LINGKEKRPDDFGLVVRYNEKLQEMIDKLKP